MKERFTSICAVLLGLSTWAIPVSGGAEGMVADTTLTPERLPEMYASERWWHPPDWVYEKIAQRNPEWLAAIPILWDHSGSRHDPIPAILSDMMRTHPEVALRALANGGPSPALVCSYIPYAFSEELSRNEFHRQTREHLSEVRNGASSVTAPELQRVKDECMEGVGWELLKYK